MNDLGRRYFLFVGTPKGKQTIAAVVIGLAAALDLTGSLLVGSGHSGRIVVVLFSLAAGVMIAGLIFILMNRRAR
ncbi:MAG: hypothetical protein NVS4B13_01810 [Candidatus Elarobacter sp.]